MKNKYVCSKCYGYIHFKERHAVITEGSSVIYGENGKVEYICPCKFFIFIQWRD